MHSAHAVLFGSDVNFPAGQTSHVDWPLLAAKDPGRQNVWSVEPVAHAEPAGHSVHWAADDKLALFEYEPFLQGSSAGEPFGQ